MLRIERKYLQGVRAATTPEDLHAYVQSAIELEHATIPTYLCAYFTLKSGANEVVAGIIRSIVIEEMLHMTIACNLLIALGGKPRINIPGFIPRYPGPLPMNVGDGLIVPLRKGSIDLVRDVFMKIEEPEDPQHYPVKPKVGLATEPEYDTIGQFYAAIVDKLKEFGQSAFKGDFGREVIANEWFGDRELFPIKDPESAKQAIAIIVEQGEGTSTSPLDSEGEPAHYYRFEQIVKGRRLVRDSSVEQGYSFSGDPVLLDPAMVWNMEDDPKSENYPKGSRARRMADQFNYSYTMLLNGLHATFNGQPDRLGEVMGVMYELKLLAQQVLATPAPGGDTQTGLCFQYAPVND